MRIIKNEQENDYMRDIFIKKCFDANLILSNPKLDDLISDTMGRYYGKSSGRVELSDDQAEFLSAAGNPAYAFADDKGLFSDEEKK